MNESIQIEYTSNYELIGYKFVETIKDYKFLVAGLYFFEDHGNNAKVSIHIPTYTKYIKENGLLEPSFSNMIDLIIKQINRTNKINKLLK